MHTNTVHEPRRPSYIYFPPHYITEERSLSYYVLRPRVIYKSHTRAVELSDSIENDTALFTDHSCNKDVATHLAFSTSISNFYISFFP